MVYQELEEKLLHARHALERSTGENIIELCRQYLALLAEYRIKLYELRVTSGIRQQPTSVLSSEDNREIRKAIRAEIETTTRERNRTEMLLRSFTMVSGYEAVESLNQRRYKGHEDWELRASGVRFRGGTDRDLMTIQEAVETASLLRREQHIAQNAT